MQMISYTQYINTVTQQIITTELETGGVLSGFSHQSIEVGCYCIVKLFSNYGNFKILVDLVLRGSDDDGDFEV